MVVQADEENRVKIIQLDEQLIIELFNWWRDPPEWLALPLTAALPEDCRIVRVGYSFERRCIEAIVCSMDFDICPEGCLPERIPGIFEKRALRHIPFTEKTPDCV